MRTLSLVIPAFNASDFARRALSSIGGFVACAEKRGFRVVEIIFVDDGSREPLTMPAVCEGVGVVVLRNASNRGKGYSVRRGALAAKGEWVLMSDVDLSAPLTEFEKLAERTDAWLVCGSRSGRSGMPIRRKFLSWLFHLLVSLTGVRGVHDTQCGFKLFRMDAMRSIFERQRIERFAFDVELIRAVQRAGGIVAEVPVAWHGGTRSSLRIFRDAPRMLWDLLRA